MNNLYNSDDSLQDSLQKSKKATYISIAVSVILAVFALVIAGIIGFFLVQHSQDTNVNLGVLMLINLGVGSYNAFVLPKLFARQANIKNKLLYLEMRDRV